MEIEKSKEIVRVVDEGLKALIIETLNTTKGQAIPSNGDITVEQMELLTDLNTTNIEVTDFTGLEYAINLTNLVMDKNKLHSINALLDLTDTLESKEEESLESNSMPMEKVDTSTQIVEETILDMKEEINTKEDSFAEFKDVVANEIPKQVSAMQETEERISDIKEENEISEEPFVLSNDEVPNVSMQNIESSLDEPLEGPDLMDELLLETNKSISNQSIEEDSEQEVEEQVLDDEIISEKKENSQTKTPRIESLLEDSLQQVNEESSNIAIESTKDVVRADQPILKATIPGIQDSFEEKETIEPIKDNMDGIKKEEVNEPKNLSSIVYGEQGFSQEPTSTIMQLRDTPTHETVTIVDPALKAAIIATLNESYGQGINNHVTPAQMSLLTVLHISNSNIFDLSGLEYACNLIELRMDNNNIKDITPIASLTSLIFVSASHNNIVDVSALAKLTNITSLNVSYNQIVDVSPLHQLNNLVYLNISNNGIYDITPLANLHVKANVSDQIITLPKVHIPSMEYTFTDILKTYKGIGLEVNKGEQVPDTWMVTSTATNDGIHFVNALTKTPIHQMSITFTYHTLVEAASFSGKILFHRVTTPIPVYIPDHALKAGIIQVLNTSYDQNLQENSSITMEQMELLKVLDISNLGIRNISGLQYATNLLDVKISNNKIQDISVLGNLSNLAVLAAHHNEIEDISGLANLTNLFSLELQNNHISNISHLQELRKLVNLNLRHNHVRDVTPIAHLKGHADIRNQTITIPQLYLSNKDEIINNLLNTTNGTGLQIHKGNHVPEGWNIIPTDNDGFHFFNATGKMKNMSLLFSYDNIEFSGEILLTTITAPEIKEAVVNIPDINLRESIIYTLNHNYGQSLTNNDVIRTNHMEMLTTLDVTAYNIFELTGLEYAKNLEKLNVSQNKIKDISVLKNLTKLRELELHGNAITTLDTLKNLTNLIRISIDKDLMDNIVYLSGLKKLTNIELQ